MTTVLPRRPAWSSLPPTLAFSYFVLYSPFLPFERLPFLGALTAPLDDLFTGVVPWISQRVLQRPLPFVDRPGSRIDSAYGYTRVAVIFAAAVVLTALWRLVGRRGDQARLTAWLRVWLRYAVANAMLYYGVAKLTLSQFPAPSPERLAEPLGDASPMSLFWAFMGSSVGYNVFTGGSECLAALLLLSRRTATLGGLLVVAVMSNVVLLNLCYDVPIKLYAFHLLVMGVCLVAPDARKLADVLVLHRATEPERFTPHVEHPSARRALRWGKAAYLGFLLYAVGATAVADLRSAHAPRSPLYGTYDVESFVRDGVEVPPLLTDATRWRRVTVSGTAPTLAVTIWSMKGAREQFTANDDGERRTLSLTSRSGDNASWHYERNGRELVLRGTADGTPITVNARKIDEETIPLLARGFRWVAIP